ncbi:MAG: HD domain-containing protein [Bacteroidota bacterium]
MGDQDILERVERHVIELLSEKLSPNLTYHSAEHTQEVVTRVKELAALQEFTEQEIEIVTIAAWFHDVGYTVSLNEHESHSAHLAEIFLEDQGYDSEKIEQVKSCILATKMPQSPKNALEQTLCDADLLHIAQDDYFQKAQQLHNEIEKTKLCNISKEEWMHMNQAFLQDHCFFTEQAKNKYQTAVKKNLKRVRDQLKRWQNKKK